MRSKDELYINNLCFMSWFRDGFQNEHGETPNWKDLIIERSAHPLPLAEDRYRAWVTGRQIFVSSLMDQEMTPYRNAVRAHLHAIGASPVMLEEITPRDEGPQRAYLSGVDRSSVLVLILGRMILMSFIGS